MGDLDLATYGWLRAQGVPHTEAIAAAKKAKDAPKPQAPVIRAATGRERVLGALQDLMAGNIVPDADTATPVPPARPAGLLGGPSATMRATTGRERVLDRVRDLYTAVGTSPLGKLADWLGVSDFAGVEEEFSNPEPQVSMGMPGPPAGKLAGKARQLSQRAEHAAAEIAAGRTGTIRVGDRTVPVVRSRVAKGSGEQLVPVDVAKFDKAWSGDTGFHIDPSGSNEIGRRREGVREFLQTGEPLHAPEVTVREDGTVVFTDGRHRFAVLRDEGVPQMPVAMSAESRANAQRHGLVASEAAPAPTIRAYHGSPHDFDQFDLSKIGTGEGAAAYGHGLYFAENEGVAKGYRDALSRGEALTVRLPGQKPLRMEDIDDIGLDAAKFLEAGLNRAGQFPHNKVHYALQAADSAAAGLPGAAARNEAVKARIKAWGEAKIGYEPVKGAMYEVGIKADPEQFLDWDAPLGQQSPHVQAVLQKLGVSPKPVVKWEAHQITQQDIADKLVPANYAPGSWISAVRDPAGRIEWHGGQLFGSEAAAAENAAARSGVDQRALRDKGAEIYRDLPHVLADRGEAPRVSERSVQQDATEALRAAGVPGIKYLDQGSRKLVEHKLLVAGREIARFPSRHAAEEAAEKLRAKQVADITISDPVTPQTRNYVVFDDKLIDILRKYGWLPPVVGAGAAAQQDR